MACSSDISVEFDVAFKPRLASGMVGQRASEVYPLRVGYFGTRQLSRAASTVCAERTTILIERGAPVHNFRVAVSRLPTPGHLFMPYYQGGGYQTPIEVSTNKELSAATMVVIKFYATTYTETHQECWATVGTAIVPLWMLVGKDTLEVAVELHRDANVLTPIKRPLIKGQLTLSNISMQNIVMRTPSQYDIDASTERMRAASGKMYSVIDRGMFAFFGVRKHQSDSLASFLGRSTKQFLRPFHVPTFVGDRQPLPSSAYTLLLPQGELSVPYFEQLLEIALERSNMSKSDAVKCGSAASHREGLRHERHAFASLCVRAMTAFALSQCYLDDLINRNIAGSKWLEKNIETVEDFKTCRLVGGDDCEGVAAEVHMHIRQLQNAPAHIVRQMSLLLQMVRDFLRLYISTLALGAVTNKKLTATELDQKNVMAHTFMTMVPFWDFYYRSGTAAREALRKSRYFHEHSAELLPFEHSDDEPCIYSPLVGEGTAPMDPAMKPVTFYYPVDERGADPDLLRTALRAVADRRVLTNAVVAALAQARDENLTIEVFGATDDAKSDWSQFYKYPVSLAVAEFADLRTFDWALVYNRDNEDARTFGIEFSDLLTAGPTLNDATKQPGVIPFIELTEEEMRIGDAILLDYEPIPNLTRAPSGYEHEQQRKLSAELAALTRRPMQRAKGTILHPRRTYMSIRARDIDNKTVLALRTIARLPMVRGIEFNWWTINAALDGTQKHNTVLDVYIDY